MNSFDILRAAAQVVLNDYKENLNGVPERAATVQAQVEADTYAALYNEPLFLAECAAVNLNAELTAQLLFNAAIAARAEAVKAGKAAYEAEVAAATKDAQAQRFALERLARRAPTPTPASAVAKPVAKPAAKPVAKPAAKPVAKPVAKAPVAKATPAAKVPSTAQLATARPAAPAKAPAAKKEHFVLDAWGEKVYVVDPQTLAEADALDAAFEAAKALAAKSVKLTAEERAVQKAANIELAAQQRAAKAAKQAAIKAKKAATPAAAAAKGKSKKGKKAN